MQLKQLSILISGMLFGGSLLLPGTGARSAAKAENLPEFYDSGSFVGQPTVSVEVTDETSLSALSGEELPASVILTVDETLSVLGENDASLGTLSEIYTADVAEKMLLVVRPETSEALTAFAAYEKENSIEEFAVLSDDVILLNSAMTKCPQAYLFLETEKMYTLEEYQTALQRANLVGAQVIVLNGETCEAEYVRYLQARFKSVWVHTDGSETAVADAVGYGAYGIIAPQAAPVYGVYQKLLRRQKRTPEPGIFPFSRVRLLSRRTAGIRRYTVRIRWVRWSTRRNGFHPCGDRHPSDSGQSDCSVA